MNPQYLAEDFLCNGENEFNATLHTDLLDSEIFTEINESFRIETDDFGVFAMAQTANRDPAIAVVVHCKCKMGDGGVEPERAIDIRFSSGTRLHVTWPGVRRLFVRVRIMETATPAVLMDMVHDDIQSGHSVSDVENPETDQSVRPWSDGDDSETDTIDEV